MGSELQELTGVDSSYHQDTPDIPVQDLAQDMASLNVNGDAYTNRYSDVDINSSVDVQVDLNIVPHASATETDDSPAGLVQRWAALIGEYQAFQDALRVVLKQPYWPGVRPYISLLKTEARAAGRLLDPHGFDSEERRQGEHRLAVSNLAAKEGMWRIIKTCHGVVALERRFPAMPAIGKKQLRRRPEWYARQQDKRKRYKMAGSGSGSGSRTEGVFVNAVADNGRTWLRVQTTTSARLLMEMASSGWAWGDDEGEDGDEEGSEDDILDDQSSVSVVQVALDLIESAEANMFQGAYPKIDIVLTRIEEMDGQDMADDTSAEGARKKKEAAEIARFLNKVRSGLGALTQSMPTDIDGNRLQINIYSARSPRTTAMPPADLQVAIANLLPEVSDFLTPTLNIDTSILVALVSDITHSTVEIKDWFPPQRVEEITREADAPGAVLRSLMGDALRGHRLVCTREAASLFQVMLKDMGQASEQARGRLLMGVGNETDLPRAELVQRYRRLSSYPDAIPDDLMLPIQVVDEDWGLDRILSVCGTDGSHLPAVAARIAREMNDFHPTLEVFFYGWATRQTTITTNQGARSRVHTLLENYRETSWDARPLVWVCRQARSLNGTNPKLGRNDGKTEFCPRKKRNKKKKSQEDVKADANSKGSTKSNANSNNNKNAGASKVAAKVDANRKANIASGIKDFAQRSYLHNWIYRPGCSCC